MLGITIIGLAALAEASPGHAGIAHLGAQLVAADEQWAGVGAGTAYDIYGAQAGWLVEAGTAVGDRGALHLQLGSELLVRGQGASLSGRYLLVDRQSIRLAVTGQWVWFTYQDFDGARFVESKLSPGLAIDAGGEKVRFDAAVPVGGLISVNQFVGPARFPFPLAGTLGVSFQVHERHRIRVAIPEVVSWHYRAERFYFDAGLLPLPFGFGWFKLGAIF